MRLFPWRLPRPATGVRACPPALRRWAIRTCPTSPAQGLFAASLFERKHEAGNEETERQGAKGTKAEPRIAPKETVIMAWWDRNAGTWRGEPER